VSDVNRIEIDEQLRQESAICKRGIETDFWRLVKKLGEKLQADANRKWVVTDPSDLSEMAQLQAIVKAVDRFIAVVEDTASLT
jgi:hypothetical protein